MSENWSEEAISLISYDTQTKNYLLTEEGKSFISSVPSPLGVVSVAGLYRTGKSYLLNRVLLDRSSGFGIGPTVNAHTKGLWAWKHPIKGKGKNGEDINVIVVDSEGIGSIEESSNHDNRIFALTILIGTCFIYNSVGSIDENAIQNLSLVVNITQNIHIKSRQNNDEVNEEDYAQYFPTFIWTVRDFTLQLTSSMGDIITPSEYLEKALAIQKGEKVEQKNKVRKLMRTLFPERDCFCLYRPTNSESDLQNLNNIPLDQLRPEFIEQVAQLREKVLFNLKPKTLNGSYINGEMLCDLIENYVKSINDGACPNIEDAWTQLSRIENQRALTETFESFQKNIQEHQQKLPLEDNELKEIYRHAKEQCIKSYKNKAIGDNAEQLKVLKSKLKQQYEQLQEQNAYEYEKQSFQFLQSNYIPIERKLRNHDYIDFNEYQDDCDKFKEFFLENTPDFDQKAKVIAGYLLQKQTDAVQNFFSKFQEQINLQKALKEEASNRSQKMRQEFDEQIKEERQKQSAQQQQIESLKLEYENKILLLQEQNAEMQREFDIELQKMSNQNNNEIQQKQSQIDQLQIEIKNNQDNFKAQERQFKSDSSESQKEKVLFQQRIQHLETTLDELKNKEKDQITSLKNQKQENTQQMKEISLKYEQQNKDLQQQIKEVQEMNVDLENSLRQSEQKYEVYQRKQQLNENQLKHTISDLQNQFNLVQQENDELKDNEEQMHSLSQNQIEEIKQNYKSTLKNLEEQISQKDEELKTQRNTIEKDRAILEQKYAFIQVQLEEAKNQLNDHKSQSEQIISSLEVKNSDVDSIQVQKIQQLQNQHAQELILRETELENKQNRLLSQINHLQQQLSETELKMKLQNNEMLLQVDKLKENLDLSENERQKLFEQNKSLDQQKTKSVKDIEERFQNKQKVIENQIDELKASHQAQVNGMSQHFESSLKQLKEFQQIERERLEKKNTEDKKRYDSKLVSLQDEFEMKIQQDQQNYEDELEQLRSEMMDQESNTQTMIQSFDHEIALKDQQIENLDTLYKESKTNVQNLQQQHNQTIDQMNLNYNKERSQLQGKLDSQIQQIFAKDREISSLSQKLETVSQNLQKMEQQQKSQANQLHTDKNQLNEKNLQLRAELHQLNDTLLEIKIEHSREYALKCQENNFMKKQIDEQMKVIADQQEHFDEKYSSTLKEQQADFQEKIINLSEQKNQAVKKIEALKKQLQNLENQNSNDLKNIEHSNFVLQQKLEQTLKQAQDVEKNLRQEITSIQNQNEILKQENKGHKSSFNENIGKVQETLQFKQKQLDDIGNNYDRDKALWEQKFNFIEQQKQQLKQELNDQNKKFQSTLNLFKKQQAQNEQEKLQNNQIEQFQNLERKYGQQILDLQEELSNQENKYMEKIRIQDKQLKELNENYQILMQEKKGSSSKNEKKLYDLLDGEKRYQQEIDNLKQERDQRQQYYQNQVDQEKDKFYQKLQVQDTKIRDSEQKKTQIQFELEKLRSQWAQERDYLITQKEEISEQLEMMTRKKDFLLRENEKMKNDSKNLKKTTFMNQTQFSLNQKSWMKNSPLNSKHPDEIDKQENSPFESMDLEKQGPLFKTITRDRSNNKSTYQ